jgi:isocitrate dehydrogenase (NAD+)
MTTTVVCIPGDGIGPEVAAAMKTVVQTTNAPIRWVDAPAGAETLATHGTLLPQSTIDAIDRCRLAIKGPTRTPKGAGHSSINVELRRRFDLHVGLRPFRSLPFPQGTIKDNVDIVLFRQNTEGFYDCREDVDLGPDGPEVTMSARFTALAMKRLAESAFLFARKHGRKKVTLITKSNIFKKWGYVYRNAFDMIAANYPDIEHNVDDVLIDAASMNLVMSPEHLDVIVTENMFGDILSDLCAGLVGGLGVAPGANIGETHAIFEAVHGTADDIAGKGVANPMALILSAAMMLDHAGYPGEAVRIRTAINEVVGSGHFVTGDLRKLYPQGTHLCTTKEFTTAVCWALHHS